MWSRSGDQPQPASDWVLAVAAALTVNRTHSLVLKCKKLIRAFQLTSQANPAALHGVLGFASAPLEDGAQLQLQVIIHLAKRDVFKSVVRSQLAL